MSHLFATAGAKLFIGPPKAFLDVDFTEADFTAGSPAYLEIGGLTNLGTLGDTSELLTSNQISVSRTRKFKGSKNGGSMQVVADLDYADGGQLALIAASMDDATYSFKLVFNDAPAGGTPSVRYFTSLVMSAAEQLNEANNVMALNSTLEIDSNIVRVSAAGSGSAPDNTVLPTITGTPETGELLTAATGTWTGSPTPGYSYQWMRDGETISGATASTYTIVEDDEGSKLRALVTATNVNGAASALSAETATVTAGS